VVNLDGESDSFFRKPGRFFNDDTVSSGSHAERRSRGSAWRSRFRQRRYLDLYEANGRVASSPSATRSDPYAERAAVSGVAGPRFEEVALAADALAAFRHEPCGGLRRHRYDGGSISWS